jgi:TPR repeat protein
MSEKRARLFKLAADQGELRGQYNLGVCYERGCGGLAKNIEKAVRLYRLSADQGNAQARKKLRQISNQKQR